MVRSALRALGRDLHRPRHHTTHTSTTPAMATPSPLKPSSLTGHVDRAFWFALSSLKLEKWKLDAAPQPCSAFYSTAVRASDPGGVLELAAGAFDHDMYCPPQTVDLSLSVYRLRCFRVLFRVLMRRIPDGYAAARGWTVNFNTKEEYRTQAGSAAKLLQDNVASNPGTIAYVD